MSAKPRKTAVKNTEENKIVKAAKKASAENAGLASPEFVMDERDGAEQSLLTGTWDSTDPAEGDTLVTSVLESLGIHGQRGSATIPTLSFDRLKFRSIGPMATPPALSGQATLIGAGLPVMGVTSKSHRAASRGISQQLEISRKLAERALLHEKWKVVENNSGVPSSEVDQVVANHKSQLELILKLLNEPSFNPKRSRDVDLAWSTISFVLSSMPHRWREDALRMMSLGTSTFGKIPFAFNNPANHAEGARVTGPPRPMGCPEAAPEGSDFALAWMIGNWWDWRLPGAGKINREPTCDLDSFLQTLRDCNNDGLWHWRERAEYILNSLGGQGIEKLTAHHDVFRAGVNFAALILFGSDTQLVGYHTTAKECNQWPEIFRHAFVRHGILMKPIKLLEALDPIAWKKKPKKGPGGTDGKYAIPEFEWEFVPDEEASFHILTKRISDAKQLLAKAVTFELLIAEEMASFTERLKRRRP